MADVILTPKATQALLHRVLAGESLTVEEQHRLLSSHEHLRAKWLVVRYAATRLRQDLEDEKKRLDRLVKDVVEERRESNEPRRAAARARKP